MQDSRLPETVAPPEAGARPQGNEMADPARRNVVRLNTDVITRDLGGGSVLVHLGTNRIYEANSTAGRVVTLLAEGRSLDEIYTILFGEYLADEATIRRDVDDLVRELADEGLLDVDDPRR